MSYAIQERGAADAADLLSDCTIVHTTRKPAEERKKTDEVHMQLLLVNGKLLSRQTRLPERKSRAAFSHLKASLVLTRTLVSC